MNCKELVELVTDYVEGAMPPDKRLHFEEHLAICPGCVGYVEQMRTTVQVVGALRAESIPPDARDALLKAFREWKRA
jgi:anti-sigma factor RsiW